VKSGVLYRRSVEPPRTCLAGITAPTPVAMEMIVLSRNLAQSPFDGARAALFRIDVVEGDRDLGAIVVGDTLVLGASDGAVTLVATRATFVFYDRWIAPTPLVTTPPEIVALLRGASGSGALAYRAHALANGQRVILRAVVEPAGSRSFVTRHDLAPVIVEEIFSG
jgi:hypothetical protein